MWMKTYFQLSSGLAKTIQVPVGTCAALKQHFEEVTKKLKLEVVQYKNNPPHWNRYTAAKDVPDYIAGKTILAHNRFVRELHRDLAAWSEKPPNEPTEDLTPEFAQQIWYGFSMLELTYDRWVKDVYVEEMETIFDVLQGKEANGISFSAEPLTAKQAAEVIGLFSAYFDKDDVRLEVPNGCDFLVTNDEYLWCPSHGAWLWSDVEAANYDYENDTESENLVCPAEGCEEVIG